MLEFLGKDLAAPRCTGSDGRHVAGDRRRERVGREAGATGMRRRQIAIGMLNDVQCPQFPEVCPPTVSGHWPAGGRGISPSTKPTTIQRSPARCSGAGNRPWTCGCCVQCLPILIDIRSRDDASLVRSGASFIDLRRLVDFRPFPKSAHLGVHRFTHDSVPLQNFELRVLDRSRMP